MPLPSMKNLTVVAVVILASSLAAQGRGRMRMRGGASSEHFTDSQTCALCHSASTRANALWSPTGDDVSPHGTWQATMMANAFRDPYWRAQVSKEVSVAADDESSAAIQALCVTCHAPAAHHEARLQGEPAPGLFGSYGNPMAMDGVTCTVCHQATGENFGDASSFSGNLDIRGDKKIYGPYEDPAARPMLMHTGFTATHGPHVKEAGLCGSCHTLFTHHVPGGEAFPEQTPYLEWRNSAFSNGAFSDEGGRTETSRTCQECHMADAGEMRIARNPGGFDFNIPVREDVHAHTFVGGNAFMLDLLRGNAEELEVTADADALLRNARATRQQLAHQTATVAVEDAAADGGTLEFAVKVTNRTGHKFPTGYPARRAWLRVQVRAGRTVVFESGGYDEDGRLWDLADVQREPHHDLITEPSQVQVYEMVGVDDEGEPTTYLTRMAKVGKDNRLLPQGWRSDGPHVEVTRPVGLGEDGDFAGGVDRVHFRVALPEDASGNLMVVAWLLYQPIPPVWVDGLRQVETAEAERFVRMYDAMGQTPETVAVTVGIVD